MLVLFISSVGWGLTWLPLKYLNQQGMQGPALVFVAFAAAALALLPAFVRQKRCWQGQLHHLALIALFGGFASLSFQIALYQGEVIRVMILFYLLPVWSVLGGRLLLDERIDRLRVVTVSGRLSGPAKVPVVAVCPGALRRTLIVRPAPDGRVRATLQRP